MLLRRGLALEYTTLGWNLVAVPVLLVTPPPPPVPVALAGFGVDSLIEIIASAVVVWQLKGDEGSHRERLALRIIAIAFVALAIYIAVQSAVILSSETHPGHSTWGIVWLAADRRGDARARRRASATPADASATRSCKPSLGSR